MNNKQNSWKQESNEKKAIAKSEPNSYHNTYRKHERYTSHYDYSQNSSLKQEQNDEYFRNEYQQPRRRPANYQLSFLSSSAHRYPPSKRGGEEELRKIENGKLQKKIYLPRRKGINYVGMLIGPRGMYQKKLEEETGWKILIRGNLPLLKRSKKEHGKYNEDDDHEHVLIISDSKKSMYKAEKHIFRIIKSTEHERNQIRQEQIEAGLKISQTVYEK